MIFIINTVCFACSIICNAVAAKYVYYVGCRIAYGCFKGSAELSARGYTRIACIAVLDKVCVAVSQIRCLAVFYISVDISVQNGYSRIGVVYLIQPVCTICHLIAACVYGCLGFCFAAVLYLFSVKHKVVFFVLSGIISDFVSGKTSLTDNARKYCPVDV